MSDEKLENLHFDLHILLTIFNGNQAYSQESAIIFKKALLVCRIISLLEQYFLLLITFCTYLERWSNFEFENMYQSLSARRLVESTPMKK